MLLESTKRPPSLGSPVFTEEVREVNMEGEMTSNGTAATVLAVRRWLTLEQPRGVAAQEELRLLPGD